MVCQGFSTAYFSQLVHSLWCDSNLTFQRPFYFELGNSSYIFLLVLKKAQFESDVLRQLLKIGGENCFSLLYEIPWKTSNQNKEAVLLNSKVTNSLKIDKKCQNKRYQIKVGKFSSEPIRMFVSEKHDTWTNHQAPNHSTVRVVFSRLAI